MRLWTAILLLCWFTTACGVKGPLYLPEKRYPQPGQTSQPGTKPIKQTDPSE